MALNEYEMARDVASWLPIEQSLRLGKYATAGPDAIEATFVLYPLDERRWLAEADMISDTEDDFMVTPFGRIVLEACSQVA